MHDEKPGKDWNEGQSDHEGVMARAQLEKIVKIAQTMLDLIGENDELEGWVQYKISRAYNDLTDVSTYVEFESASGGDSLESHTQINGFTTIENEHELEEAKKKKPKGLWHNIRARRAAGKPRLKPGQKGYPKTLNIESKEFRRLIKDLLEQELKR
jgi:hypothetical protein